MSKTKEISAREALLRRAIASLKRRQAGEVHHPALCVALKVVQDGKADRAFYSAMLADGRFVKTAPATFALAPEGE